MSDMEIDGPIFVPKVAIFFKFGSRSVSKSWLFLNFLSNFRRQLFRQNVSSFKQEIHLCAVYGFLTIVLSQFCPNIV